MTRRGRMLAMGLLALLLLPGLTAAAQANAAEPPGLTVLVSHPPASLSLSIRLAGAPAGGVRGAARGARGLGGLLPFL